MECICECMCKYVQVNTYKDVHINSKRDSKKFTRIEKKIQQTKTIAQKSPAHPMMLMKSRIVEMTLHTDEFRSVSLSESEFASTISAPCVKIGGCSEVYRRDVRISIR